MLLLLGGRLRARSYCNSGPKRFTAEVAESNFAEKAEKGVRQHLRRCYEVKNPLVLEVRVDPSLDLQAAIVFGIKAYSQRSGFVPADGAANIDPGQSHQRERNLDVHS